MNVVRLIRKFSRVLRYEFAVVRNRLGSLKSQNLFKWDRVRVVLECVIGFLKGLKWKISGNVFFLG